MKTTLQTFTTAALLLAALSAPANVEVYFAQDVSPWPVDDTGTVPRPAYPNSQAMQSQFLARLHGTTTESFEGYATWSFPTNLLFGTSTATLSASDPVPTNICVVATVSDATNTYSGMFPTTGTNFLDLGVTDVASWFRITFSSPQAAIGFYGTDPERSHFRLTLAYPDGSTNIFDPPITVPQGSAGVFYLGVIDRANPFTSVTVQKLQTVGDDIGVDDMTIGTPDQVAPAPAQLQIVEDLQLQIQGTVGATYRIDFSNVLPATNWVTIITNFGLCSRICGPKWPSSTAGPHLPNGTE